MKATPAVDSDAITGLCALDMAGSGCDAAHGDDYDPAAYTFISQVTSISNAVAYGIEKYGYQTDGLGTAKIAAI